MSELPLQPGTLAFARGNCLHSGGTAPAPARARARWWGGAACGAARGPPISPRSFAVTVRDLTRTVTWLGGSQVQRPGRRGCHGQRGGEEVGRQAGAQDGAGPGARLPAARPGCQEPGHGGVVHCAQPRGPHRQHTRRAGGRAGAGVGGSVVLAACRWAKFYPPRWMAAPEHTARSAAHGPASQAAARRGRGDLLYCIAG